MKKIEITMFMYVIPNPAESIGWCHISRNRETSDTQQALILRNEAFGINTERGDECIHVGFIGADGIDYTNTKLSEELLGAISKIPSPDYMPSRVPYKWASKFKEGESIVIPFYGIPNREVHLKIIFKQVPYTGQTFEEVVKAIHKSYDKWDDFVSHHKRGDFFRPSTEYPYIPVAE